MCESERWFGRNCESQCGLIDLRLCVPVRDSQPILPQLPCLNRLPSKPISPSLRRTAMAACMVSAPPSESASLWATPVSESRGKRSRCANSELSLDSVSSPPRLYSPSTPSPCQKRRVSRQQRAPGSPSSLRIDVAATHQAVPRTSTCVVRPSALPRRVSHPASPSHAMSPVPPASPCSTVSSQGGSCLKTRHPHSRPASKGRRIRFAADVKAHDGLCCANRIFDELVWEHMTTLDIACGDDVVAVVRRHLAADIEAADRAHGRARCVSGASTDSEQSEFGSDGDGATTLGQALSQLQQQTLDLGSRIAAAERSDASGAQASVPVLPHGGGYAAKLTPKHLSLVLSLAEMVQQALEDALLSIHLPAESSVDSDE